MNVPLDKFKLKIDISNINQMLAYLQSITNDRKFSLKIIEAFLKSLPEDSSPFQGLEIKVKPGKDYHIWIENGFLYPIEMPFKWSKMNEKSFRILLCNIQLKRDK